MSKVSKCLGEMKLVFVFKLSVKFSEPEYKSTLQQIEGKSLGLELVST